MTAQPACLTSDLEEGEAKRVSLTDASGRTLEVAVVRDIDGDWHAILDICSHGQVALSEGEVFGCTLECWLHGSSFDLRTGHPLALPATQPVPVYPVTIDGEHVLVDVDNPVNV